MTLPKLGQPSKYDDPSEIAQALEYWADEKILNDWKKVSDKEKALKNRKSHFDPKSCWYYKPTGFFHFLYEKSQKVHIYLKDYAVCLRTVGRRNLKNEKKRIQEKILSRL